MPNVTVYSTAICPYCVRAKAYLKKKGIAHINEIRIDHHPDKMKEMFKLSQRRTVPQIFIDDFHVGGFDDLYALDQEGNLDPLLKPANESGEKIDS